MKRHPMVKNCRFCGRFMEFYWVEVGSEVCPLIDIGETLIPMFYCSACGEWDKEIIDVRYYEWLIFEGTIDFDDPKMPAAEFIELLAEDCLMQELFRNRPYMAIPVL